MANVTLLQYNNYFNRIIKKEASYAAYLTAASGNQAYTNINFNPGDSVRTSIILGTSSLNMSFDYLLVHHTENNTIVIDSRWFIMDENRTRDGQYELNLKRDVIIDNYNKVINSPIFIEKGYVNSTTNPLLYNSESMTYNQMKVSETPIKDKTNCGWVVGYIPQDAFEEPTEITKDIPLTSAPTPAPGHQLHRTASLATWDYYDAVNTNPAGHLWTSGSLLPLKIIFLDTKYGWGPLSSPPVETHKIRTELYSGSGIGVPADKGTSNPDTWSDVIYRTEDSNFELHFEENIREIYWNVSINLNIWNCYDAITEELGFNLNKEYDIKTVQEVLDLAALKDDILYVEDTRSYYKIELTGSPGGLSNIIHISSAQSKDALLNEINTSMRRSGTTYGNWRVDGNHSALDVFIGTNIPALQIKLRQITYTAKVVLEYDSRHHVLDAPYDIFCIPYSDTNYVRTSVGTTQCNKQLAVGIAQAIAAQAGSQAIYDTQLLPYCPSAELVATISGTAGTTYTFDLRSLSTAVIRDASTNALKGAIIWCTSNTLSFDTSHTISVSSNPVDRKVLNECDMYRLCSGNYQGVFEFSAAKSYGVAGFHIDCTFKPFNPYIHVTPNLGGLYGTNYSTFNDSRGLICGGEFSLAQLNNAWANYELLNKNYQNIFDRLILSMDFNNSIVRQEAGWNIAAGIVGGGVGGAMTGATVGGGYGAIAGALIGGGTSLAGGMMDYANLEARQEEAKDYATDMFGYQLGNIKALPTSLAKNSALTANTKIFPFVEKYTCTDTEEQALRNKITYNGMTMMVISTLNNYMIEGTRHFFKGKIIRLSNLGADNHMAQAIYEELNKGVYI